MVPDKNVKLSAKNIWGKVTLYLREHNNIVLHITCGDIMDVEIENDVFVISTNEYTVNFLNNERNYSELAKALKFFGYEKFEIRKKEKAMSQEENILRLNKLFDGKVKII